MAGLDHIEKIRITWKEHNSKTKTKSNIILRNLNMLIMIEEMISLKEIKAPNWTLKCYKT